MKPHIPLIVSVIALATAGASAAEDKGEQMAMDMWKACGGENWPKVQELRFSFVVEQEGKSLFHARHNWNVAAGTDEVKWTDKEGKDHQVTTNLLSPPTDDEGKAAYARWVNDSYWLMAPLKIRDRGVKLEANGSKDLNGVSYETLRVKFENVGLTPTDQYVYYLDPKTKLPLAWDYIPQAGTGMQATWEKYQSFGGINFATEHHFDNKAIKLEEIEVVTKKQ